MYLNRRISSTATAEAAGDRGSLSHLKDEMPWVTVLCESPACVCGRWMDGLSLPDGARPGTKCSTTLLTAWRGEMNGPLIMDLCTVPYGTVLREIIQIIWPVVLACCIPSGVAVSRYHAQVVAGRPTKALRRTSSIIHLINGAGNVHFLLLLPRMRSADSGACTYTPFTRMCKV